MGAFARKFAIWKERGLGPSWRLSSVGPAGGEDVRSSGIDGRLETVSSVCYDFSMTNRAAAWDLYLYEETCDELSRLF